MGTWELLCQGVKWPVREADYPPPSIAKVENGEAIHLHSAIYLHGVVVKLINHADSFTVLILIVCIVLCVSHKI